MVGRKAFSSSQMLTFREGTSIMMAEEKHPKDEVMLVHGPPIYDAIVSLS